MGLEIPDELKPVAALVVSQWPETDETGLRGAADTWEQMGALLEQIDALGGDVVQVVLANTEGRTHDAIAEFWTKADGALGDLAEFCEELAFVLRVMATLVLAVKLYIISMLIYLAIQLAIAAAAAVETLGASVAEGAAVQMAVRTMISTALRTLVREITVRTVVQGAAIGATVGVLKEAGFQTLETRIGIRDGYDGLDMASAGVFGGITGAVAAPVTKLLGGHGPSVTGNKWGDMGANWWIGQQVGKAVAGATWGDQPGIAERAVSDAGEYVRKEIVAELTGTAQGAQQDSEPSGSERPSQGSSLDLPPP